MATTQNFNYPSSSDVTITGIGNPTGQSAPADAIYIAGVNPEGLLTGVAVTDGGAIEVTPTAGSLTNVNLTEVNGASISEGQKTSANSLPVVIASDQSTLPISASSLPLPAGAATSALQSTGNTALTAIEANQTNGTQVTSVSNFPATQPVTGTITANQGTANASPWNENISQYGGVSTSLGSKVSASSIPVVIASDQGSLPLPTGASTSANQTNGSQLTGLIAGSAIIGKVGIDQTTPGTTNGVQINAALPVGTNNIGSVNSLATTPTAKTITNAAITVGTSAVRLTVSGSAPASDRVVLVVTPDSGTASSVIFYIGTSTVTNSGATRGIEIQAGQSFIANNDAGDYWIVSSVAGQTVTVLEQS